MTDYTITLSMPGSDDDEGQANVRFKATTRAMRRIRRMFKPRMGGTSKPTGVSIDEPSHYQPDEPMAPINDMEFGR